MTIFDSPTINKPNKYQWLVVGKTGAGFDILRKPNGVGGFLYCTNELGAVIYDSMDDPEDVIKCIELDRALPPSYLPYVVEE